MTTFVTGATGLVGSHVARQLVNHGHVVRIFSRPTSTKISDSDILADLSVERAESDLRDAASIERAMPGIRQVFHVAADYRFWSAHPEEIYDSNVEGTRKLLEAAQGGGVEQRLPIHQMISHRFPLERIADALELAARSVDGTLKVVITHQ